MFLAVVACCLWALPAIASQIEKRSVAIVAPADASVQERLATREIRRYVYLRTDRLLSIARDDALPVGQDVIVVATKGRAIVDQIADAPLKAAIDGLQSQQYVLKTIVDGNRRIVLIVGGDDVGTLYGTYRFIEHLGVRFFLHGDVVPDGQIALHLPDVDETGKPTFELRGLNPWGSHPFGFDLWNADDYKAHVSQMAKMRMNFIGMHCYPEGHPYAEPTVWIGLADEFDSAGRVSSSYPSSYYNAALSPGWGGLRAGSTARYHLGAAMLFDRDDWGPEVMRGATPRPTTPEACNEVFNRTAAMFRDAFGFARPLGVKTCIGTESPLTIPAVVQEKLKSQGKNPADPAVIAGVYEAMFRRIAAAHPLDYFWLWTPEGWTWRGNAPEQMKATVDDVTIALAATKKVDAPFQLATSGWVLGPADDRAGFDKTLPAEIPLSAISRHLGEDPVDPAYGRVQRRDKWAIPWMEGDNGGLAVPQLWVGRTRQDAVDARRYGCTGLMGLIWRTRILGPNIAALAQAGWEQPWDSSDRSQQNPEPAKDEALGGKFANYAGAAIAETDDDVLYQSCRSDTRGYRLKVPPGAYRVTLQFCEPHFDAAGKRVCDVRMQGKTAIRRLDIFAEVGKFAALDRTFDDVQIADGQMTLDLVYVESLPCISGIVIEGKDNDFVRKINCGGPAHGVYAADLPVASSTAHTRRMRKVACDDFYTDWATALFGSAAAGDVAEIFACIDSRLPRPLCHGCPAGIRPDGRPWDQVAPEYAFVDELAACRDKVTGPGSRERFDYWLGTMQYLRAGAKLDCAVGKFNAAMARVNAEKDPTARKKQAAEIALPVYREILAAYTEAFGHLLDTTSTNGALATVMYWEHSFYHVSLGAPGAALAKALGEPLPPENQLPRTYRGDPRLIVPTVRTSLSSGERLRLNAIVLSATRPKTVTLHWRELGTGSYQSTPLTHQARGVYQASLPAATTDLEYYIEVIVDNHKLHFPATVPVQNQTVVLMDGK